MDQNTAKPTAKVAATGVAGAAAVVVVFVAAQFGVEVPETVAGAFVLVASWLAGYIKRERKQGEHVAG